MGETERLGVEHLPRAKGETVVDILAVFLCAQTFQYLHAAVFLIGKERMSDGLHVHANLVGSSRLQTAFHERYVGESLQYTPVGDCLLGIGVLIEVVYPIYGTVARVAREGTRDGTALLGEGAPDKGIVGALGGVVEELLTKVRLRLGRLGDEQQPAGVLVNTVHQTYLGVVDVEVRLCLLEIVGKGVEQGVLVVAVPRVHHQARRLVDNQHIGVLIDYFKGDVLGLYGEVYRLMVEHDLHEVERLDLVVACHRLLVHKDIPCLGSLLDTISARTRHVLA